MLNGLAYADLIPVIDGGIAIDALADGSACATPPGGAASCVPAAHAWSGNRQLDPTHITIDRQGQLDDPQYIVGAGATPNPRPTTASPCRVSAS